MKKFEHLGKSLTKAEQKTIMGGTEGGGGGRCVLCECAQTGWSSCWYTTGSADSLCSRVYPTCIYIYLDPVDCAANGCVMN